MTELPVQTVFTYLLPDISIVPIVAYTVVTISFHLSIETEIRILL